MTEQLIVKVVMMVVGGGGFQLKNRSIYRHRTLLKQYEKSQEYENMVSTQV